MSLRLAVLGAGHMGGALVTGILAAKRVPASHLFVTDLDRGRLNTLRKKHGVAVGQDNRRAVRGADVILVCVKPAQTSAVFQELAGRVGPRSLVISVAAGVRTERMEKVLGAVPVIRVMPNTPALLRCGALVYALGQHATRRHERVAKQILGALGRVWKVPEPQMDAVTALSGSGPAYVFYLAEALASAGVALGLSSDMSNELARQTVFGAGQMLAQSLETAEELRRRVTSPGGTTEAAIGLFMKEGFSAMVQRAMTAAHRRSKELSVG